jgi:hypothetical protein
MQTGHDMSRVLLHQLGSGHAIKCYLCTSLTSSHGCDENDFSPDAPNMLVGSQIVYFQSRHYDCSICLVRQHGYSHRSCLL